MNNRRRRRAKEIRQIRRRWIQLIIEGSSFQSRVGDLSWLKAHDPEGRFCVGLELLFPPRY